MKTRHVGLMILFLWPVMSLSCGSLQRSGASAQSGTVKSDAKALARNPALRPVSRAAPKAADLRAATPPAPALGRMGDVSLGTPEPTLTETLDKSLALLAREKAESEALRKTVSDLKESLAEKDRKIGELTAQLQDSNSKVEKLEGAVDKWKEDVLGFRDEMRKAGEAQIDALQQILALVGKGKEEKKP